MSNYNPINSPKLTTYVDNQEALMSALERIEESVYLFDVLASRSLYANRSILHIMGYDQAAIDKMGAAWSEMVVHPEDYGYLSTHINSYKNLQTGRRSRVVYRVKMADGSWRMAESTGVIVASSNQDEKIVLGTSRLLPDCENAATGPTNGDYDHRCRNCSRLLGKAKIEQAVVEIKCARCGEYNGIPLA